MTVEEVVKQGGKLPECNCASHEDVELSTVGRRIGASPRFGIETYQPRTGRRTAEVSLRRTTCCWQRRREREEREERGVEGGSKERLAVEEASRTKIWGKLRGMIARKVQALRRVCSEACLAVLVGEMESLLPGSVLRAAQHYPRTLPAESTCGRLADSQYLVDCNCRDAGPSRLSNQSTPISHRRRCIAVLQTAQTVGRFAQFAQFAQSAAGRPWTRSRRVASWLPQLSALALDRVLFSCQHARSPSSTRTPRPRCADRC